jgi:iron complex transport system substrate-binding protein
MCAARIRWIPGDNSSWSLTFVILCLSLCSFEARPQTTFLDDAQRRVTLPDDVARVFAAGAPAEVLLYTLVPEMLVGRNHLPPPAALEFMPPAYHAPAPISNLPDRENPRYDVELLAFDVDVYIDYGTVDDDYVSALEAITGRTGIPGIILDGTLTNVPAVYRRLGSALGVPARGELLAAEAERIIRKYQDTLADKGVKVYLACSRDGTLPCVEGHSSGEATTLLGAINVAGTTETAPNRPLAIEEIRQVAPDFIIAANSSSVAALRADPGWREIQAVAAGRIYAPPELPFNWGPRPPSVNRLLGVIWLAYVLGDRPFDAAFYDDLSTFFETFYHMKPTASQLERLVGN